MARVAFVFAGQGDQYPGMGEDLYRSSRAAQEVFAACDAIRPGTSAMCFHGSAEELKRTSNTQPCLYAMELAAAAALQERGIRADCLAGFSLGELTAAAFAGYFSCQAGFRLVIRRADLMQACADREETGMLAVLGLDSAQVDRLAQSYDRIYPVNYNCPGQTSVAGARGQIRDFMADVRKAGGRAIPLRVAGAFHSPFMEGAREPFAEAVSAELARAEEDSALAASAAGRHLLPLYSDRTAEPYGENVTELLSSQLCHPVRWEELVRNMIRDGVDHFIEIGPGRTLTNMIRRISADLTAVTYREMLEDKA